MSSPDARRRIASRICCIGADYRPVTSGHEWPDTTESPSLLDRHCLEGAPQWPVPSSSLAPARRSASCRVRWPVSPPPSSAGSPSRPRSSAPASRPKQVDYVFMGQVLGGGSGPDHGPPGSSERGHPDDRPVDHGQQGVPLGSQHDLPRRPDDPGRRRRHRRCRRHGVDDQRAVPPPGVAGGLPLRRRRSSTRSSVDGLCCAFDALPMGAGTEKYAASRNIARERAGRPRREVRTSAPRRPSRTAASTTRSSRSRSRSARATRSSSTPTRACVRARRVESLGALQPAFDKAGNITAGNASQISDGGERSDRRVEGGRGAARGRARSARSSATARSPGPIRRC